MVTQEDFLVILHFIAFLIFTVSILLLMVTSFFFISVLWILTLDQHTQLVAIKIRKGKTFYQFGRFALCVMQLIDSTTLNW